MRNAMTVDVEDYYQVSAFAPYIRREDWPSIASRVEHNVDRLLALFSSSGARCTFFTLGDIALRHPAMVRRIVESGNEVASHGLDHRMATSQSPAEFREDVRRAKGLLEDITGVPVLGYRAPSFSINSENDWAFDCLLDAGYRYSSSVYPVRRDHYGAPDASRVPYSPRPGLVEVPLPAIRHFGRNFPAGGGGFFRFFPYGLSRWMLRDYGESTGQPAVFYVHPWEIDPEQPRTPGINFKTRFRHYLNLGQTESRLQRLLSDFEWDRIDSLFLGTDR